jgi:hypothetical protein
MYDNSYGCGQSQYPLVKWKVEASSNDWTGLGFGQDIDPRAGSRRLAKASSESASQSLDTAAGAISLGPVVAAVIVIGLIVAVIAIFLQLGNSVLGLVQDIASN